MVQRRREKGCAICHNNLGSLEYLELGIGADRENAAQYFITAAEKETRRR